MRYGLAARNISTWKHNLSELCQLERMARLQCIQENRALLYCRLVLPVVIALLCIKVSNEIFEMTEIGFLDAVPAVQK